MKPNKEYNLIESIPLSSPYNRKSVNGPNRISGLIRSIVITSHNNSSAKVFAFFEQTNEKVFLKVGVPVNFKEARNGCVLEWEAQQGAIIDVTVSQDTHIPLHSLSIDKLGDSYIIGGDNFTQTMKTISNVPQELITKNENRVLEKIINRSDVSIFFGTFDNLNAVNFLEICEEIVPQGELIWDLKSALFFRTISSTQTSKIYSFEQVRQ